MLAVVHDLPRAAAWAERLVLLRGGRIAAQGTPDAVLASPAASEAFEVTISARNLPGQPRPLYLFSEPPPTPPARTKPAGTDEKDRRGSV